MFSQTNNEPVGGGWKSAAADCEPCFPSCVFHYSRIIVWCVADFFSSLAKLVRWFVHGGGCLGKNLIPARIELETLSDGSPINHSGWPSSDEAVNDGEIIVVFVCQTWMARACFDARAIDLTMVKRFRGFGWCWFDKCIWQRDRLHDVRTFGLFFK